MTYKYANRLRPPHGFMPAMLSYDPNGTITGTPDRFCRHGVVEYDFELSEDMIRQFDLMPFGNDERLRRIAAELAKSRYAEKMLELPDLLEDKIFEQIVHPSEFARVVELIKQEVEK
jgi:hypothetical protein